MKIIGVHSIEYVYKNGSFVYTKAYLTRTFITYLFSFQINLPGELLTLN
jgi:hypothetical protein